MDRLAAMETFVRVVATGSLAAAAAELKLSRPVVTTRIAGLEASLRTKLLNRTTRGMSVTDLGQRYYDFCVRVLDEVRQQEEEISQLRDQASGKLRVLAAKSFGSMHMGQAVSAFSKLYPDIDVSLTIADIPMRTLDPIAYGMDVAIRTSSQPDSGLFRRRIGTSDGILCASPDYLRHAGIPKSLPALSNHRCLVNHHISPDCAWHLYGPDGTSSVKVQASLSANSSIVLRQMALAGMGISILPTFCVAGDLKRKKLVHVLKAYKTRGYPILAIFPEKHLQTKRLALFVEFLAARFSNQRWDRYLDGG